MRWLGVGGSGIGGDRCQASRARDPGFLIVARLRWYLWLSIYTFTVAISILNHVLRAVPLQRDGWREWAERGEIEGRQRP